MNPGRLTRRGFTLIETILAALLLSTVVAGMYGAFVSAARWNRPPFNIAHNIAREKLENLYEAVRADWWDTGTTAPAGYRLDVGSYPDGQVTVDGLAYSREYIVSAVQGGYADYRRVEVKVQWPTE